MLQNVQTGPGVMAHVFNANTREAKAKISEFGANLIYRRSSRMARAATEKPCLEKNTAATKCKTINVIHYIKGITLIS